MSGIYDVYHAFMQSYGLWITIALCFLVMLCQRIELKRVKKDLYKLQTENQHMKKAFGGDFQK